MAGLCLEKLIALGGRKIVLFGWCGSLSPSLEVGDLLVPSQGISEEGTSKHYSEFGRLEPDKSLGSELEHCLKQQSLEYQRGPLWTTDAPYRETQEKVAGYADQGVLGVDMEFSALCSIASFRGIQFAGLMLVSDELWRVPWKAQFGNKKFKNRSRQLINIIFNWLNQ